METNEIWDCIVVGGGAAGLSAALVLGRARRTTLVVDAGRQSNLPAAGIGGLLGHDGRPPHELYEMGRRELAAYPAVEVRPGEVVHGERSGDHFVLALADGRRERARNVVLATGMDYRRPDLPGLEPLWGRSVFHCPFCHGWEVRDRPLAVLGGGPGGLHRALLLRNWSDDVVLLTDGPVDLDPADLARLEAAGVAIDARTVVAVEGEDGHLRAVVFAEGPPLARAGLMVGAPLAQRSALATELGLPSQPPTPMALDALTVDSLQQTAVPGAFVAGDLGATSPHVTTAIASGAMAGVSVVRSLMEEQHGMASGATPAYPRST